MRNPLRITVCGAFFVFAQSAAISFGEVTQAFTFQGQLKENGLPAPGPVNLEFQLHKTLAGSDQLGVSDIHLGVPLVNGLFTVIVNGADQFDGSLGGNSDTWLEVWVDGAPMSPRQPLTAVPYASFALNADVSRLNAPDGSPTNRVLVDNDGRVGIGTGGLNLLSRLSTFDIGSPVQTTFTQGLANAGINLIHEYANGNYTPGLFWSTTVNNPTKPKAGIYLRETNAGTEMHFGTSNSYVTGITNDALMINQSGMIAIGGGDPLAVLHVRGGESNGATGTLALTGSNAAQTMFLDGNEIDAIADGLFLNNNTTGNVVLANGGGHVGVGTSNPSATLTVSTPEATTGDNTATFSAPTIGGHSSHIHYGATGDWYIRSASASGDVFIQDTGGSVGIGAGSPIGILHVRGGENTGATGTLMLTGSNAAQTMIFDGNEIDVVADGLYLNNNTTQNILMANGGGRVGVGRNPATNKLEVEGNASKTAAGTWLANSDASIKTEVKSVRNALSIIDQLRPVAFRYTDEYRAKHPSLKDQDYYNYIAQEFREIFPDSVQDSGQDGLLQMDSHPANIYAVAAIQELHQIVKEKDCEIAELREARNREVDELRKRLAKLEALIQNSPSGPSSRAGQ